MESGNIEPAEEGSLFFNPFAYGTAVLLKAKALKGLVCTGVVQLDAKVFISIVIIERTSAEGSVVVRVER